MSLDLDPHSLIGTLYAFFQEHERRGELESDVEAERVWMMCGTCGAVICRALAPAQYR